MPHALIGYAGSTLRAAELFHETFPDDPLYVLVDYFGKEITDSLRFVAPSRTWRGRGVSASDWTRMAAASSRASIPRHRTRCSSAAAPRASAPIARDEPRWLVGTGATAAAIFHLREQLDEAGYDQVKIIASSGFDPRKCKLMASVHAPIDFIGTGSYLPELWSETTPRPT